MLRWIGIFLLTLALNLPGQAQEMKLQVLATSDTHAAIMAEDPFTLRPSNRGWAKLATLIRQQKARHPHTLLLDGGDTIQGDPSAYLRARVRTDLPDAPMAIMNALGYHAMTVGNHDFDWGQATLRQAEEQATFPWLAANLVTTSTGKPAFTPYAVVEMGLVRVGILGLANSSTTQIVPAANLHGLRVEDALATARTYVPLLRTKEKADVVVVFLHGGMGRPDARAFTENQGMALAEQVPGIDLLLLGHTHTNVATRHNGVPILQPMAQGQALGVAELSLRKERQGWKVVACTHEVRPVTEDLPPDPQVLELTAPLRAATEKYLNTSTATLTTDLDGRWSRMEDSALMQLIHTVQRQAVNAQLSAAASPSVRYFVPKGPTSIRQFWALMPYENLVARIPVTGLQLKLWLEHAARYYNLSHQPELVNREVPGFDFDMIDGVSYALDISRPLGQRVVDLKFNGQPVKENQTFTMAITSYRLSGGGGYLDAIHFKGQAQVQNPTPLRNLLFEYVLARPTLSIDVPNRWRIIPALDRERVLAQTR
ncbi:MAG: bifunctional metallophosphatase/5'-nucleotidase [Firmicutes bacterium]|nr:bifunctional metallophosphatase/5'-nucleotidase [Bacillota bacterium]